jgi:hypothetical protein
MGRCLTTLEPPVPPSLCLQRHFLMMFFLIEKRSAWRGSVVVAAAILILSACLFLGAVAHEGRLGTVAGGPMTAASVVG